MRISVSAQLCTLMLAALLAGCGRAVLDPAGDGPMMPRHTGPTVEQVEDAKAADAVMAEA